VIREGLEPPLVEVYPEAAHLDVAVDVLVDLIYDPPPEEPDAAQRPQR